MTDKSLPNWNRIVESYAKSVFRISMRILGSIQDAEDVSQEVFTEAFQFHKSGPVQSWSGLLARIATLRSIDRLRRHRPTVALRETDRVLTTEPFAELATVELKVWIRKAITQLPDQQAAVFALFHFEQLTRDEIANTLNITTDAVSTALYKARQRLRNQLLTTNQGDWEMNHERLDPDLESLEPPFDSVVEAIRAEELPEDAIERIKNRAKQLENPSTVATVMPCRTERKWTASRFMISGLSIAAAILVAVTGVALLINGSSSRAFAQVIEKVKAIRSVRFTTSMQLGQQRKVDGQMYFEGKRQRFEQFEGKLIQIADLDQKKALFLDTVRKLAQPSEIDAKVAKEFDNPIDKLRNAQSKDAESIGQEILRGRRTQIYRLRKVDLIGIKGEGVMQIWVHVESQLPAKIVIRDPDPKSEMEMVFDEFVWNEPMDPQLFSLTIPDGFQKGVILLEPHRVEPATNVKSLDSPNVSVDGILSRDMAPAQILWDRQGTTITALLRDPESVPAMEQRQHELRQWDVATGKLKWSQTVAGANMIANTPDGKLFSTIIGREIQLRDSASGKVSRKWTTDKPLSPMSFSPDGKVLAAGIAEWGPNGGNGGKASGGVQFWDVERASLVRSISDDKPVTFVKYSRDGKSLATSSNSGPVKLWDVSTGELLRIFPGCCQADFSPDNTMIACQSAASSTDKTIGRVDLYQLQDGKLLKTLSSEKGTSASFLLSVTFSNHGRMLAASDWNGTVTVWDVATGQRKQTIKQNQSGVLSATFAPDDKTLATGSEDKTLHLWKLTAESNEPSPMKK